MTVQSFDDFINESYEDIDKTVNHNVAGIAISFEDKVLLVHPTNASWKTSALGIPKGGIEDGEDPFNAAIRELYEETGITVNQSDIIPEPMVAMCYNKDNKIEKQLIYFVLQIQSLQEIGLSGYVVPREQLQLEEVDWAGFVKIEDAYPKIHRAQMIILDRLR